MSNTGKPRRRRALRRIFALLLALLILAGGALYAWNSLKKEYTVTYDSYTASTGSISNALSFSGNLSLVDSATYTAGSSGKVRTLYVAAGDAVKEDDKLVRLANGETVTAGFDGRVNTLSVAVDDEVQQGDELVQIADFSHLKVTFRVDEYDIGDVAVGMDCTITVTSQEKNFPSRVDAIDYISASSGNVAYYSATAYVDVEAGDGVLPGMQVTVSIPKDAAENVVVLKVDALSFDFANQAFVWMKEESGELRQVYVTTGVSNGNYIEIREGLSDGDEVFVEAPTTDENDLFAGMFGSRRFNQRQGSGMGDGDFDPNARGDFDADRTGGPGSRSGSGDSGFGGGGN